MPSHRSSSRADQTGLLLHWFAGCRQTDMLQALQIEARDLFVAGTLPARERATIANVYDYVDGNGEVIAQKVRTTSKQLFWRRPDPSARGGRRNGLGGAGLPDSINDVTVLNLWIEHKARGGQ